MLDLLGGKVYNLPSGNTQQLSVRDYMKAMGASNGSTPDGGSFEPVEPIDKVLQTGVDATQSYYNSLETLNNFGLQAHAKGYDVFNPGRDPQSVAIAKEYQRLAKDVQMQGNGLRAGHELQKFHTQQRLKEGVFGPGAIPKADDKGYVGATTIDQSDQLINTNPWAKSLNHHVEQTNKMAKSYDTKPETIEANHEIEKRKKRIDSFFVDMISSGVPIEYAEFLADRAKNAINSATHDNLGERKLAQKTQNDAARRALDRKKFEAKKGKEESTFLQRDKLIRAIINGDENWVGQMKSGTLSDGNKIVDVKVEKPSGKGGIVNTIKDNIIEGTPGNVLRVTYIDPKDKKKKKKTRYFPMDPSNRESYTEINSILSSIKNLENISIEELSKYVDFDFDTGDEVEGGTSDGEMTLEGFGKVTMEQLEAKYTPEQIQQLKDKGLLK